MSPAAEWGFLIGTFVGTSFGLLLGGIFASARRADDVSAGLAAELSGDEATELGTYN